jgi:hypothetical protein
MKEKLVTSATVKSSMRERTRIYKDDDVSIAMSRSVRLYP